MTGALLGTLELKFNARVILTVKVDLEDRLVNGQLGVAKDFQKDQNGNILKINVTFDECEAGLKTISKILLQVEICVSQLKRQKPILEIEQIKIRLQQLP